MDSADYLRNELQRAIGGRAVTIQGGLLSGFVASCTLRGGRFWAAPGDTPAAAVLALAAALGQAVGGQPRRVDCPLFDTNPDQMNLTDI